MVGSNPALANIVSKDFDVIEGPTRMTRGLQFQIKFEHK